MDLANNMTNEISLEDGQKLKIKSYMNGLSDNLVLLVEGISGIQVLKLYGQQQKWVGEAFGLKICQSVNCFTTPKVDKSGFMYGHYYHLMDFIDGSQPDKSVLGDNGFVKELGHKISLFHNACIFNWYGVGECTKKFFSSGKEYLWMEANRGWDELEYMGLRNLYKSTFDEIGFLLECFDVEYGMPVHRDFSLRNILIDKSAEAPKIVGIVDFEHCESSLPEFDFTKLYLKDFEFSLEKASHFMDGYLQGITTFNFSYLRLKLVFLIQGVSSIRYGLLKNDNECVKNGEKILDFVNTQEFKWHFKYIEYMMKNK